MRFVVDASVAVKWFVDEEGRDQARLLLGRDHELSAPDLVVVEVLGVLSRKRRASLVSDAQAGAAIDDVVRTFDRIVPASDLAVDAFTLAGVLQHSIYDCFYLALARRSGDLLVTADRTFATKVRDAGMSDHLALLGADARLPALP